MPEILIKDQALTRTIEEIADAYRAVRPSEYAAFCRLIDEDSRSLLKPTGMSSEGTLLDLFRLPASLYSFIKQQMRKRHGIHDFFAFPENYRLLMKVWSSCALKRKPTQMLHLRDFEPPETPATKD